LGHHPKAAEQPEFGVQPSDGADSISGKIPILNEEEKGLERTSRNWLAALSDNACFRKIQTPWRICHVESGARCGFRSGRAGLQGETHAATAQQLCAQNIFYYYFFIHNRFWNGVHSFAVGSRDAFVLLGCQNRRDTFAIMRALDCGGRHAGHGREMLSIASMERCKPNLTIQTNM
jgi:hypothetical protein